MAVDVDHIEVQPSVSVDVGCMQAAARSCVARIPGVRCIGKGAVTVVEVEAIGIQVIAGVQVEPTVVVEIRPQHRVRCAVIRNPRRHSDFFELHVTEVSKQPVGRKLGAHIDVLSAIAVEISDGDRMVQAVGVHTSGFGHIREQPLSGCRKPQVPDEQTAHPRFPSAQQPVAFKVQHEPRSKVGLCAVGFAL